MRGFSAVPKGSLFVAADVLAAIAGDCIEEEWSVVFGRKRERR